MASFEDDFDIAPAASGPTGPTVEVAPDDFPKRGKPVSNFEDDFEVAPVAPAKGDKTSAITLRPVGSGETPKPGILANAEHDDIWAPLKNIATATIKGLSDIPGAVGNTANMADYLLARAESAATGKPVENVLSDYAAARQAKAANPSILSNVEQYLRPENTLPSGSDVSNPILSHTGEFVPTNEGQKLAAAGIQTVFGSLGPGVRGAAAPVNALLPSIIRQSPMLASSGALAQGVTDATGDPLLGAGAAAVIPSVLRTGGAGANALVGRVDPATAQLADTARNVFGIPVGVGEVSSNPTVRFLNSVVNKLPGSGGGAHREAMQTGFNRALTNTVGEDAPSVTPQVMAHARDRIGDVFEDVAHNTPFVAMGPQHAMRLGNIIQNAQATMTPGEVEPLIRQVQNIASLVDPRTGGITGEIYQNLTKKNSPLDRAMHSPNSNIRESADDIRDVLDDAFQASARPEDQAALRQARYQWKNMRTIEPLVAKAPTGDISPALLQGRVNTSFKGTHGSAYGGGGDLKTLSDIGQRFMKEPPSSGTAERGMLMHLLGGAGAGGLGMMTGEVPLHAAALAAAGTLGSAALARLTGAGLRSNTLTNRLINRSLGNPTQTAFGSYLYNSTLPAVIPGNVLTGRP